MNDDLLNKYWEAETTPQEEQLLMKEFMGTDGSEAAYFKMISHARQQRSRLTIEDIKAYNRQHEIKSAGPMVMPLHRWIASAAAILVFVVSGIGLWQYSQQAAQTTQMAETFDDPQEAYEEVREALAYLSTKLNQSQDEALLNIKKAGTYADMFK
jgi:hypothetical protein